MMCTRQGFNTGLRRNDDKAVEANRRKMLSLNWAMDGYGGTNGKKKEQRKPHTTNREDGRNQTYWQ